MHRLNPSFQYISKKEIELKGVRDIILAGDVGCTGFDEENKNVLRIILSNLADIFIILGDLALSGSDEEFETLIDFCAKNSKVPIFAIQGNHDLPSYPKFLGSPYYAMILERSILISLDNAAGRFSDDSITFLDEELKRHKDKKAYILFHIPPPTNISRSCLREEEWIRVRSILDRSKDNVEAIISAHIHGRHEYVYDGYKVIITAGGGAAMIYELPYRELMVHNFLKMHILPDGTAEFNNVFIGNK